MVAGALVIAGGVGTGSALLVRGAPPAPTPTATPAATPSSGPTTAQAQALYSQVRAATLASSGFRYIATTTGQGVQQSVSGAAGRSDGRQEFSWTSGYGAETFSLILTPDAAVYFRGNPPALEDQLGVPATRASSLDGRWISVMLGDGPYHNLEVGITISSQLSEDTFQPRAEQTVAGPGGATLTKVSGIVPANQNSAQPGTAYFEVPSGSHLPATWVIAQGGLTSTTTFSAWGTAPTVSAPSGAVAWSSLQTSAPPGGYGSGSPASPAPGSSPTPAPSPSPTASPSGGGAI